MTTKHTHTHTSICHVLFRFNPQIGLPPEYRTKIGRRSRQIQQPGRFQGQCVNELGYGFHQPQIPFHISPKMWMQYLDCHILICHLPGIGIRFGQYRPIHLRRGSTARGS
jgi:hypothetical protein